jgi:hypothetical protein
LTTLPGSTMVRRTNEIRAESGDFHTNTLHV